MTQPRPLSLLFTPLCALALGGSVLLTGCGGSGSNSSGSNSSGNGNTGTTGTGTTGTTSTGTTGTGTTGPGTTGGNPGMTPPTLAAAVTGLNALVCSGASVSVTNLTTTVGQFDQARQFDPTNKDAQLGYAISAAALAGMQYDSAAGSTAANLRTKSVRMTGLRARTKARLSARAAQVYDISQALTLWQLPTLLNASGQATLPDATNFLPASVLAALATEHSSTVSSVQAQTALAALDASLVKVEQALSVAGADPNYTYTLADPSQACGGTATVKVGSAEIQTLGAIVGETRAAANVRLAYNADPGTFNLTAAIPASAFATGALPTSAYLPASPFGTLQPNGAALLQTVKQELNNAATQGVAGIELAKTHAGAGFLLDPTKLGSTVQLNAVEAQIKANQSLLTGPQPVNLSINGRTFSPRVSLTAFLDHPEKFPDLKAFLPSVVNSTDSAGNNLIAIQSYPDLTFAGVFPDALPFDTANPPQAFVGFNGNFYNVSAGDILQFATDVKPAS